MYYYNSINEKAQARNIWGAAAPGAGNCDAVPAAADKSKPEEIVYCYLYETMI